ncbi:MAG: hypothetical protein R3B47_16370 [Bacteroidia bacterium]
MLVAVLGLTFVSCKSTSEKSGGKGLTEGKIMGQANGIADSVYVFKVDGWKKKVEAYPVQQENGSISYEIQPQVAPVLPGRLCSR